MHGMLVYFLMKWKKGEDRAENAAASPAGERKKRRLMHAMLELFFGKEREESKQAGKKVKKMNKIACFLRLWRKFYLTSPAAVKYTIIALA